MRAARRSFVLFALAALAAPWGCAPRGASDGGDSGAAFDPDSVPEGYGHPSAALAWPFAARAFEITAAGDLYNGDWLVALRPSAGGVVADLPRAIAYEERWRPVAHWRRRSAGVRWDFEACALPSGAAPDSGLFASVEIRATNQGRGAADASIEIALEPRPAEAPFAYFDAPDSTAGLAWAAGGAAPANGWIEGGGLGRFATRSWHLGPGGTERVRIVLTAYPVASARLASWARTPHARRAAETRRAWSALLERGAEFELGDTEVESALRAALVVLLSCRERRGSQIVPVGNPFQYRDVWLRDGARVVAALTVAGHTKEARALADGLTLLQWPSGAFLSQAGQLDGTGQALWAMGQSFLRAPPQTPNPHLLQAVREGWRWCEAQRAMSRSGGSGLPGLMPFGDPHDNENVRAELVGNDAWSIAGYRWGARLLRAADPGSPGGSGLAAAADSMDRSRAAYEADFHVALEHCGSRDIPPAWSLAGQRTGLDWGNLSVAWPCGVLAARDPRAIALARRVWARAGGAGLASYRTPDTLSYYLGADLGTWALLAGERAAADSVLDAMLLMRSASGGAGEVFHRKTRDVGDNLAPHATAAAALVTLIRNTLMFDDGDTLELTLGARSRWWRGGRVSRAPTRWGMLDLEFRDDGDSASWRWTPVAVWTALHLPPGDAIAEAPRAPLQGTPGGTVVLAPPGVGSASVKLTRGPNAAEGAATSSRGATASGARAGRTGNRRPRGRGPRSGA